MASLCPIITACTLPGPYRLRHYASEFTVLYTNKVPVSPYRGAGRPHAVFVMERIMDRIASELHLDRLEVRSRNFIASDEFPWDVGLVYQDGGPTNYDSGDYQAGLEKLKGLLDYEHFPEQQEAARAQGRYLGIGVACYVEGTGIGPYEGAKVSVESDGRVYAATGVTRRDRLTRPHWPRSWPSNWASIFRMSWSQRATRGLSLGRGHICQPDRDSSWFGHAPGGCQSARKSETGRGGSV